jgi:hypothetical protein
VPDVTDKDRKYPVLRFRKGDLYVIVGFREPQKPMALGVYAQSRLDPDTHHTEAAGGGGSKTKRISTPTTFVQLKKRIAALGCVLEESASDPEKVVVTYKDQELGKVQVGGTQNRVQIRSDWNRIERKVDAIDRRETA